MEYTPLFVFIIICSIIGFLGICLFFICAILYFFRFIFSKLFHKPFKPYLIYSDHRGRSAHKKQSDYIEACWNEIE